MVGRHVGVNRAPIPASILRVGRHILIQLKKHAMLITIAESLLVDILSFLHQSVNEILVVSKLLKLYLDGRTCLHLGWSGHWVGLAHTDLRTADQVQEYPACRVNQVNKNVNQIKHKTRK